MKRRLVSLGVSPLAYKMLKYNVGISSVSRFLNLSCPGELPNEFGPNLRGDGKDAGRFGEK